MKKILLAIILVLGFAGMANAQSTLALQEKCSEGGKKFFHEAGYDTKTSGLLLSDFTTHYNKKLDKCFILVTLLFSLKDKDNLFYSVLDDVFEKEQYDLLVSGWPDTTKTSYCVVGDKICHSGAEFGALIKPYME